MISSVPRVVLAMAAMLAWTTACGSALATSPTPTPRPPTAQGPLVRLTPVPGVPGDPQAGRRLFVSTGCGGCHTLSGVDGANGVAGPILNNVVLRPTLAGETIPMSPETLTRWLLDPAALKPGTPMPSVGLTEPEARDVAAYLYSLPRTPFP